MSASPICISVEMLAKPGCEEELQHSLADLAVQSRKEPGCVIYVVHRGVDAPRRFFLYEQYRDMAAVEAHRAANYYQRYANELIPALVEQRQLDLWQTA